MHRKPTMFQPNDPTGNMTAIFSALRSMKYNDFITQLDSPRGIHGLKREQFSNERLATIIKLTINILKKAAQPTQGHSTGTAQLNTLNELTALHSNLTKIAPDDQETLLKVFFDLVKLVTNNFDQKQDLDKVRRIEEGVPLNSTERLEKLSGAELAPVARSLKELNQHLQSNISRNELKNHTHP